MVLRQGAGQNRLSLAKLISEGLKGLRCLILCELLRRLVLGANKGGKRVKSDL